MQFRRGFIEPEMVKPRPVVVVSPRLRNRANLVGVVPLSTTAPHRPDDHHCQIELARALPPPFGSPAMWAKCDMFCTVALSRLDRFKAGRRRGTGARIYLSGQLDDEQLKALRCAVLHGLGLSSLTVHL